MAEKDITPKLLEKSEAQSLAQKAVLLSLHFRPTVGTYRRALLKRR